MKILGLVGKNIAYSFSEQYFNEKFKELKLTNYSYQVFDIHSIDEVNEVFNQKNFLGCNVTIPYKQSIIPFLDELSEEANEIGAVNTIVIENKKKIGYNTDAFGFKKSLLTHLKPTHATALILGDGGASKSVQYVLNQLQIPFKLISRKGEISFTTLSKEIVQLHKLIIQTTPVGTFPNVDYVLDFPFEGLSKNHLVMDLIYNPEKTRFLRKAEQHHAEILNGLQMLYNQADKSWEIWVKANT